MKSQALKEYKLIDGKNFTDKNLEKDLRKVIKLLDELGWKYSQTEKRGKTFCTIANGSDTPRGKLTREYVELTLVWKK